MSEQMDEQARELARQFFRKPGLYKADSICMETDITDLAVLLARVRQQALEEAAQVLDRLTDPLKVSEKLTWINQPMTFCRVIETLAVEIRSLRQEAGEGTK